MSTTAAPGVLPPANELAKIRDSYRARTTDSPFHCVLSGASGSGKTTAAGLTARKPVLMHCFDPRGADGFMLNDAREKGSLFVEYFDSDDLRAPKTYRNWETRVEELAAKRVFDTVGTYVIDSLTFLVDAASRSQAKYGEQLTQPQYGKIAALIKSQLFALMGKLPCDFILTTHLDLETDELTMRQMAKVSVFKSLQNWVPTAFNDMFVMQVQTTGTTGTRYEFLTQSDGRYIAKTSLANLNKYEPADFTACFKKAGRKVEDLPY